MYLKYLVIALRKFKRSPTSSVINVLGMTLAFSVCLLIGGYVYSQLSADHFHAKKDRIFRVNYDETSAEMPGPRYLSTVGPTVGPAMKASFPQVVNFVRFRHADDRMLMAGTKRFYENGIYYADPSVFEVFDFPFVSGEGEHAFRDIHSIVLTESAAAKYFGAGNPIGQVLTMDGEEAFQVTGVLKDLPANSHLQFDFLIPFEAFKVPFGYPVTLETWGWISFFTYVELKPNASSSNLERLLSGLIEKNFPGDRAKRFVYRLQPLSDIFMGAPHHPLLATGNVSYVTGLSVTALLILLAACFNFANLFISQSTSRAKEIGIRKISGAARSQLVLQFLGEAAILSVGSMMLSLILFPLLKEAGQSMLGLSLSLDREQYIGMVVISVLVSMAMGVFAAVYPAFVISAFDSGKVLKSNFKHHFSVSVFRKAIVVSQFAICIAIISSVLVIGKQMQFIRDRDLGFAKDELLLLQMNGDELAENYNTIRNRLEQNSRVSGVTIGGNRMDGDFGNVPIFVEGSEEGYPMAIDAATYGFYSTIGIDLVAGRELSENFPSDSAHGVIINQAAARILGWTDEEAVGKPIRVSNIVTDGQVVGVLKNFHFGSLHTDIAPLVSYYPRTRLQDVYVRINKGATYSDVIASLQRDWSEIVPDLPFDYTFLNAHIESLYLSDKQFSSLFSFFSFLAIAIACVGLYGLVSQELQYRVKEIGVRKVLGATLANLLALITGKFFILILIGNLVAWPAAWYFLRQWLENFAYHINVDLYLFALAGLGTLMLAFITIAGKSFRAAIANPVDSLRNE